MKRHPSSIKEQPAEDLSNPNDDGCVLGTAGRDEDPNATTDWGKKGASADARQPEANAQGSSGFSPRPADDRAPPAVRPPQDNDQQPAVDTPPRGEKDA